MNPRATWIQAVRKRIPCGLFLLFVSGIALAQSGASVLPVPIERSLLGRRHEEALRLNLDEFDEFLAAEDDLAPEAPRIRLRAMFLRAGSPAPLGLPASRGARREATRQEALDYLRERLDEGDLVIDRELERVLESPIVPDVLWAAAANVAAATLRYNLSGQISDGLSPERSTRIRAASIRALHSMFVRWIENENGLEAIRLAGTNLECGTFFRDRLVETDALARKQAIRLVELESPGAGQGRGAREMLQHADPEVRAAAARVLGQAIASGSVDTGETIAILILHLEEEIDAAVWFATVRALLEPLASAPIDSPELADLRALLERSISLRPDLRSAIAWTLTRIPWDTDDPTAEASILVGIDRMSRLFEEIAVRSAVRDEDELLAVLNSLEGLFANASDAGTDLRSRPRRARQILLRLVADSEVSNDIRASAVATLALVSPVDDVQVIVSVLESEPLATSLAYELLGALGDLAEFVRPESDAGKAALQSLVQHTQDSEVDLRLRAFSLLLEPRLEFLVRLTRPAIWIEGLEKEDEPGLQSNLLRLLERDGQASNLETLLASPAFERVRAGEDRQIEELGSVLRAWTASDVNLAMLAAERLVDPARPVSLKNALSLLVGFERAAVAELPSQAHCEIRSWAFALQPHGSSLLDLRCEEGFLIERVLALHLPICAESSDASINFVYERAVLTGALLAGDSESGTREIVDALFADALQWNAEHGDESSGLVILLSRARFALALGEAEPALDDYRTVYSAGRGTPGVSQFTLRDLRAAIQLAKSSSLEPADRAREAAQYYELLVQLTSWREELAGSRLADLSSWVREALESRDVLRVEAARVALTGDLCDGLEESAAELAELGTLLENYGAK